MYTYQRVARVVLTQRADPFPASLPDELHPRHVQVPHVRHHPVEVGEVVLGKHRVRVGVRQLQHSKRVFKDAKHNERAKKTREAREPWDTKRDKHACFRDTERRKGFNGTIAQIHRSELVI